MRNLLFFLAASNLLLLSGCGPTPPACDASTCAGCCTPQGTCAGGGSPLECGSGGANCSACAPGQSCLTGACFTLPSCTPKTCASASANCGALSDGCGGMLSCGTCTAGESCGAGGTPNVCGPGTCTPRTCSSAGFDCGMASDGCAALLDCGTCQTGSTCTANRCTCQPRTCSSLGKDCGPLSDGCGRTLDCGTCTSPQTCGGGGTANVCGTGSCTPTTCAAQGKDCGSIDDGCGGMLSCGTCTAPQSCGGAAVPNVCGATCALSCPPGYSCDALGACRGGSPVNLSFDVRTFTVSGSVTLNGAPPSGTGSSGTCSSSPRGWVEFSDATRGYSFSLPVACMGTPAPFTGLVYPGTYLVKVRGNTSYSNLPGQSVEVQSTLVVAADVPNLAFDVLTHTVSGSVTLNGAPPSGTGSSGTCSSSPRGWVELTEETKGYSFSLPIACMGTPAPFTGLVYPGTYRVKVRGNTSYSNLPGQAAEVQSALAVTADVPNLAFNVQTFTVSGSVALNGAPPSGTGSSGTCSSSPRGWVELTEETKGYSFSLPIACLGTPAPFTGLVYPGTYRVKVRGNTSYSNLPGQAVEVQSSLAVTADVPNLAFDVQTFTVSGSVALNGAPPSGTGSSGTCSSSPRGWVELDDATRGYSFSLPIACMGAPAPFSGLVYPGTYRVRVRGNTSYSNLPGQAVEVQASLVVSADVPNLAFNVQTFTVGGSVALNGAPPSGTGSSGTCSSSPRGWVELTDATRGYSFSLPIACMGTPAPFTGLVYPGTYRVKVRGNTSYSNLPGQSVEVQPTLVVSADVTTLAFNVQTYTVSGSVTLNGLPPSGTGSSGACSSSPRGWVELDEERSGYSFSLPIACMGTPAPFTGLVYAGTYRVSVRGNTSYSNLPGQSYTVVDRLVVP